MGGLAKAFKRDVCVATLNILRQVGARVDEINGWYDEDCKHT